MAGTSFAPHLSAGRRIPFAEIDATVAARLGATRGLENSQPACFNRQVAMYLAKHIGNWSTKTIGRYYGGRDHSTVCYGIQRIESLRETDPDVDALIANLKSTILTEAAGAVVVPKVGSPVLQRSDLEDLADLVAECIIRRLSDKLP